MSNTTLAYYKVKPPASILNSRYRFREGNRQPVSPFIRAASGLSLRSIAPAPVDLGADPAAGGPRPGAASSGSHAHRQARRNAGADRAELRHRYRLAGVGEWHRQRPSHSQLAAADDSGRRRSAIGDSRPKHACRTARRVPGHDRRCLRRFAVRTAGGEQCLELDHLCRARTGDPRWRNCDSRARRDGKPWRERVASVEPSAALESSGMRIRCASARLWALIARNYGVSLYDLQALKRDLVLGYLCRARAGIPAPLRHCA